MPNAADMQWFKQNFHAEIEAAIAGTPFTVDLLVAIACQETGHIWSGLRKKPTDAGSDLELCVGDTLDRRRQGSQRLSQDQSRTARQAEWRRDVRDRPPGAGGHGASTSRAFRCRTQTNSVTATACSSTTCNSSCEDPDYFLEKRYEKFSETLGKCIEELTAKRQEDRPVRQAPLDRYGADGGRDRLQHRRLQSRAKD